MKDKKRTQQRLKRLLREAGVHEFEPELTHAVSWLCNVATDELFDGVIRLMAIAMTRQLVTSLAHAGRRQ